MTYVGYAMIVLDPYFAGEYDKENTLSFYCRTKEKVDHVSTDIYDKLKADYTQQAETFRSIKKSNSFANANFFQQEWSGKEKPTFKQLFAGYGVYSVTADLIYNIFAPYDIGQLAFNVRFIYAFGDDQTYLTIPVRSGCVKNLMIGSNDRMTNLLIQPIDMTLKYHYIGTAAKSDGRLHSNCEQISY